MFLHKSVSLYYISRLIQELIVVNSCVLIKCYFYTRIILLLLYLRLFKRNIIEHCIKIC